MPPPSCRRPRAAAGPRPSSRLTTTTSPRSCSRTRCWPERCDAALPLIQPALSEGWSLDVERIVCPVRIVWGAEDRLLSWPSAAARYRVGLPHADWVVLDGVGHCPQLDVPVEAAELILTYGGS